MKFLDVVLLLAVSVTACAPLEGGDPEPSETRRDLRALLGADARPVGVAVDPETGQRFVLEPELGILELLADGGVRSVWTPTEELPQLTDLCAVGGGRFVAAADGDGYIIDTVAGAARQHFCLEPGWDPGFEPEGEVRHANRAVVCDSTRGMIFGQPQTLPQEGAPIPLRSEIAAYDLGTGDDLSWQPLPDASWHAGGMALLPGGDLLLGAGAELSRFDPETGAFGVVADLTTEGVRQVEALTVSGERLLVVDGADGVLVELPLSRLDGR